MITQLSKITPALFVGAAAAAIAVAPPAIADPPPPPPCVNADGTPCSDIGNITGGGAEVNIPTARPARQTAAALPARFPMGLAARQTKVGPAVSSRPGDPVAQLTPVAPVDAFRMSAA